MIHNHDVRLRTVRRLLISEWARLRVAEALYEVARDGMAFGPRDLPRTDDRDWLRGAMAVPIQDATDLALDALAIELTRSLDGAPSDLAERIAESRRWQELGWD